MEKPLPGAGRVYGHEEEHKQQVSRAVLLAQLRHSRTSFTLASLSLNIKGKNPDPQLGLTSLTPADNLALVLAALDNNPSIATTAKVNLGISSSLRTSPLPLKLIRTVLIAD